MDEAGIVAAGSVAGVELWRIDLDGLAPGADRLLSDAELARAARHTRPLDRDRFVAGRAALRLVLARYGSEAPAGLALQVTPQGKPFLPGGPPFSLSRSGGVALLGVGRDRELGVDLERVREIPEAAGIAARLFGERERAAWRAAGGDRGEAFLRIWTRKEALLKALGLGLAGAQGAPPPEAAELHDLDVAPGHLAALAVAR